MFKGFYNLTSAMLTHQHNLNVVGNNMVNISTAGFKQERYIASTFDEVMYSRVGNQDGRGEEIGEQTYIRAASENYTDYTQGTLEPTGLPLDFAITGDGFFAIQSQDGEIRYTRMGNFSLDAEGYLSLSNYGRVLNPQGGEIYLGTDKVTGGSQGQIYYEEGGLLGQVGVFAFENQEETLQRDADGLFLGENAQLSQNYEIHHACLERSNADITKQMVEMITAQRALQSAAQITTMYDSLMTKATGEIGRI